jgi:hypothetical protein
MNFRLSRLLHDTCDIWRPDNTGADSQGVAQAPTWGRVATNEPAYYMFTLNVDDPGEASARSKRMTFFTTDQVTMQISANVRDGDYLRNTTAGNENFGTWHRVEGAPNKLHGAGGRIGSLVVMAMEVEHPPAELKAAAGV